MPGQDSVKSLMNPRVISVLPETPILIAIDILLSNNYNGIPVTDKGGVIVGILTKYDLILKRTSIRDDTKVKDIMNDDPLVLFEDMTVEDAIRAFAEHHRVDPIPVVDSNKKVVGIISRYDMVRLFREYGSAFGVKQVKSPKQNYQGSNQWVAIVLIGLGILGAIFYYLGYF